MALAKKHLKCPDCGELRHFKNHAGTLVFIKRDGKKCYDWHCPKCNIYGSVEKKR